MFQDKSFSSIYYNHERDNDNISYYNMLKGSVSMAIAKNWADLPDRKLDELFERCLQRACIRHHHRLETGNGRYAESRISRINCDYINPMQVLYTKLKRYN